MFKVRYDSEKKIWNNPLTPSVYNTKLSLGHFLLRSMEKYAPKICQVSDDTGEIYTFEEMRLKTIRAAQNLQNRGYTSKQMIATVARNVADLAPIVYASICLGSTIVPLNKTSGKQTIVYMFKLTEPKLVFCEIGMYDLVVECLCEAGISPKIFTFNGAADKSEDVKSLFRETGTEDDFVPVEFDGMDEIGFIACTSGSTGLPKGVCLSHARFTSEIDTTAECLLRGEVVFNPCSLEWIMGIVVITLVTIAGGTRVITTEEYSPESLLRIIERQKVTVVKFASNRVLELLKCDLLPITDLSNVNHVDIGGFRIATETMKQFMEYLPNGCIVNGYGMTEVGHAIAFDYPTFTGTVGRLNRAFTIKIINEKGERCGVGVTGEIYAKGRHKFLGYYKNKQLTDEALDSDGFFKTMDIGFMDEHGNLTLLERKFNILRTSNFTWVLPSEIEEVILRSPEIKNACVVGVPIEGSIDLPAAAVVRASGSQITEDEVFKMVEDNLRSDCKLLGGVNFIDSMPLTSVGKPNLKGLKEYASKMYKMKGESQN